MVFARLFAALLMLSTATAATANCASKDYKSVRYTVCEFEGDSDNIRLFHADKNGDVYGTFDALKAEMNAQGNTLRFAMNAGMYHKDRSPVGGYGENFKDSKANNTNTGLGNFHMLPNGVFWISEDRSDGDVSASVATTDSFNTTAHFVRDYTQSGPMLVIDGKLHPKFQAGSSSLRIRNGVGVDEGGTVYFVKSEQPVNFHSFASLFKDALKTPNALYLDGTVSKLYAPELGRNDRGLMMGPIVAVVGQ